MIIYSLSSTAGGHCPLGTINCHSFLAWCVWLACCYLRGELLRARHGSGEAAGDGTHVGARYRGWAVGRWEGAKEGVENGEGRVEAQLINFVLSVANLTVEKLILTTINF